MICHPDDQRDTEQLHARQVGESPTASLQQVHVIMGVVRIDADIDQQVERVRWLMQREPMLEGREPLSC